MVVAEVSMGWAVLAIVCSYALGTIPGSVIVARRYGLDLHQTGDGNPGAWNALEQLGWNRAWPAFFIDGAKGLIAAILGWLVVGTPPLGSAAGPAVSWLPWDGAAAAGLNMWLPWACVGAAMLGHAFPAWAPRSGGKSLMAFVGGAVALIPVAAVPLMFVAGAFVAAKRGAVGTRVVVAAFPVVQATVTPLEQVGWTGILMTLVGALFLLRRAPHRAAAGSDQPRQA